MSESLSIVPVVVVIEGGEVVMLSLLEAVLLVAVAVLVMDGEIVMLILVNIEGVVVVVAIAVPIGEVESGNNGCVECCR